MEKVLLTVIVILILSACSSGVSQEQFNQLLEQNQQLIEQNQELKEQEKDFMVVNKVKFTKALCDRYVMGSTYGLIFPCGELTYLVNGIEKKWTMGEINKSACFQDAVMGEPLPMSCRK
tara:strand:+ start:728 stop:1084 length:357 start_codon:yes stop_codon:yes gene_type:complete